MESRELQLHPGYVGKLTGPFTSATLTCSGDLFVHETSKSREIALFFVIQWKPLNVITVNVIIRLMLSALQRPALLSQTSGKKAAYCDRIHKIIRLLLSVFQIIHQTGHIFVYCLLNLMKN